MALNRCAEAEERRLTVDLARGQAQRRNDSLSIYHCDRIFIGEYPRVRWNVQEYDPNWHWVAHKYF